MTDRKELLTKFGISLAGFKTFIAKRLSSYKLSKSARDEFLDANGVFQEEEAFNASAYIAIQSIMESNIILNKEGVAGLLITKDLLYIQDAVYFQAVFLAKNNTTFEKITGTTINTPGFQANIDTSRNILLSDSLGTLTKTAIKLSEISKYKLVPETQEGKIYVENTRGEIQVVGTLDDALLVLGGQNV